MARKKAPNKRADRDSYPTPHWCIDILAEWLERSLPMPDWVVDLGAGDGRIGSKVRGTFQVVIGAISKLMLLDIVEQELTAFDAKYNVHRKQVDVLDWFDTGKAYDIIDTSDNHPERVLYVSNPPFSLGHEFVWRAVSYVKTVHAPGSACAFLLRAGWWIGGGYTNNKRADWLNENPPDAMIGLCPRPSFVKGTSDNSEYAWYVWMHGTYQGTQMEVALKDRNGKQRGGKQGGQECLL